MKYTPSKDARVKPTVTATPSLPQVSSTVAGPPLPSQSQVNANELTQVDLLPLTAEQWEEFDKDLQDALLSDDESSISSSLSSEIEVRPTKLTSTPARQAGVKGPGKVEGVFDPDPFIAARQRNLHGPPIYSSPNQHKRFRAYVVYRGWEPGVYFTWSAASFQTAGYPNAALEGFKTEEDARRAYSHSISNGTGGIGTQQPRDPNMVTHTVQSSLRNTSTSNVANPAATSQQPQSPHQHVHSCPPTVPHPTKPCDAQPVKREDCAEVDKLTDQLKRTDFSTQKPTAGPSKGDLNSNYRQSYRNIPPRSDIAMLGANSGNVFVVVRGREPGVYYGQSAAEFALGNHPDAYMEIVGDSMQAYQLFSESFMEKKVVQLR